MPRHLRGLVVSAGGPPPAGAPVMVDGAEVGKVTSVAWAPGTDQGVALAYVGRGVTPPAAAEVPCHGRALPVTVVDLPMG